VGEKGERKGKGREGGGGGRSRGMEGDRDWVGGGGSGLVFEGEREPPLYCHTFTKPLKLLASLKYV
jgi:hypothetical protein